MISEARMKTLKKALEYTQRAVDEGYGVLVDQLERLKAQVSPVKSKKPKKRKNRN